MLLDHVITSVNNAPQGLFETCYVYFNWFEALSWFCLAAYVWGRFIKYRRTRLELIYGFYILVFGLTDMFEVYQLTAVLFLTKVLVLLSILVCRFYVVREYRDLNYKIEYKKIPHDCSSGTFRIICKVGFKRRYSFSF